MELGYIFRYASHLGDARFGILRLAALEQLVRVLYVPEPQILQDL